MATESARGHKPGNAVVNLNSRGRELICIGDLVHDPIEFERADIYAMIDFSHAEAIRWRDRVLAPAAAAHTLVWACHFPFPGVGYLRSQDGRFSWQPVTAVPG